MEARQVWRAGFSFGYLILDAVKRDDGVREIRALDDYEVSATSTPMNGTTRVLAWKSRDAARARREDPDHVPSHAELLGREVALGLDGALTNLEQERNMIVPTLDELAAREAALADLPFLRRILDQRAPDLDGALARMRNATREQMLQVLGGGGTGKAHVPRTPRDEQRHRANQVAAEFALERALTFDPRA
jgi:hypothetical protein